LGWASVRECHPSLAPKESHAESPVLTYRRGVRREVDQLLRDVTLVTLVFAIAIGWALYQVGSALGYFFITIFQKAENTPDTAFSFSVGSHVFYFDPLIESLIAFAFLFVVALLVRRRYGSSV